MLKKIPMMIRDLFRRLWMMMAVLICLPFSIFRGKPQRNSIQKNRKNNN